jgi:OCT family organic cation transporter-like MFS transporter 4/5
LLFSGAFVNSPEAFAFFRFLTGFSVKGLYMMAFILAVESVGPKFAAFIGIATNIPFAIGELILGLEAYFIRDWRTLQILVHAPVLFLILLWFVLPESPRWLIAAGRIKEAEIILKSAAKVNKKTIPQHILKVTETKEEPTGVFKSLGNIRAFVDKFDFRKDASHANTSDVENKEEKSSDDVKKEDSFLDLFRPRAMMWRTFNLCFQWFSVTFVYYGLSFGSTSLSGDPYSNFCLNIFVEIPGYLFAMSVMDCWGRKPILAFCQILPGLACIFAGLLAENTPMAPLQVISTTEFEIRNSVLQCCTIIFLLRGFLLFTFFCLFSSLEYFLSMRV